MVEGDERTADECDGVHVKDYCKECGCPKEICCRKEGAINELELLLNDMIELSKRTNHEYSQNFWESKIRQYLRNRLKELLQGDETK